MHKRIKLNEDVLKNAILSVLALILIFIILRDSITTKHDFSGYIIAGKLAWERGDIYSHYLNTWPPSFSVFSIPLYLLNSISHKALQFVWLSGFTLVYVLCFKWLLAIFFNKDFKLSLKKPDQTNETLKSWVFIVPFLLGLRIFVEEVVNIQINIYLMGMCLLALHLLTKGKQTLPALLIAITILCKAYTILLLPFFIFRKRFILTAYVLGWISVLMLGVFMYFGFHETIQHHITWWSKDVLTKHIYDYGNQSIWGFVTGLVSNVERFSGVSYNLWSFTLQESKIFSLGVIGLIALIVGIVFIYTYNFKLSFEWQYIILISFIPLFSPIAWKYYFVFLLPLTLNLYIITRQDKKLRILFLIPILLITLSSELFVGSRISDILEAYGIFTHATLFLLFVYIYIFTVHHEKTLRYSDRINH